MISPALLVAALVLSAPPAQTTTAAAEQEVEMTILESAYESAKKKYGAANDKAAFESYVNATTNLATAVMTSPHIPAREKYPRALRLYREALKADPGNQTAKENIALIEGIYESLGRPVPE